eukprot:COSAG03_NODE_1238_length_4492_cov_78.167084_4_plen_331_part_00
MAAANPRDSALFQRMRQQADAAEAEERAKTEAAAAAAAADANWEALRDPQGRLYYYNKATNETSWQLPTGTPPQLKTPPRLPLAAQPDGTGAGARAGAGAALDDMASSALSQAVATIQQLTEDVAEQHRARAQLEQQLAHGSKQGEALKEITMKSVALLNEKKEAVKALDAERQRRERAEAALAEARAAVGSSGSSDNTVSVDQAAAKVAALEAERDQLRQTVARLEKKTSSSGKLAQMWKQIDGDDSGELDAAELKKVMLLMGKDESALDMGSAMASLDKDSSGSVSFGEFQTWWDEQDHSAQEALTTQVPSPFNICVNTAETSAIRVS